ncbi:hypothetical protein [Lactococcus lactis]|uniref:Uncharacterized protein n=1 Tax=Lactococcus lactis TaxID=1358 RepID=A0AAW5TR77_9LACT|nr:hypothetical protein [Lactococcus lactis]MCW2281474.1 hypothetical protein [Lactococcus lactis]
MAIVLEKTTVYGRVYLWQSDELNSGTWSRFELKWRNPEGRLIKVDSDSFERLPEDELQTKFEEAVRLVESPEWDEEQKKLYIEKLEYEIAERQQKIQLAKLTKRIGETNEFGGIKC